MRRVAVLALMIALSGGGWPLPAVAAPDVAAQVTRQLRAQGYRDITQRRTILGRVVVTARGRSHDREIVVDPRSGVLLRDLVRSRSAGGNRVAVPVFGDNPRQGAASGDDRDDDRDDRDDDDRDDDDRDDDDRDDNDRDDDDRDDNDRDDDRDNSGRGSDSSGRGSGGDGRGRDD